MSFSLSVNLPQENKQVLVRVGNSPRANRSKNESYRQSSQASKSYD